MNKFRNYAYVYYQVVVVDVYVYWRRCLKGCSCNRRQLTIHSSLFHARIKCRPRSQGRKCEKEMEIGEGGKIKTERKRRERGLKDGRDKGERK